jgi:hypothetical protein
MPLPEILGSEIPVDQSVQGCGFLNNQPDQHTIIINWLSTAIGFNSIL